MILHAIAPRDMTHSQYDIPDMFRVGIYENDFNLIDWPRVLGCKYLDR